MKTKGSFIQQFRTRTSDSSGLQKEILLGSMNLDIMKDDITRIIRIIFGLLRKVFIESSKYDDYFAGTSVLFCSDVADSHSWSIFVMRDEFIKHDSFMLNCYANEVVLCLVKNSTVTFPQGNSYIQQVYEVLPVFVNGMVENFPELKEKLEFLQKAAKCLDD